MAASSQALNTYELLENILLHLPLRQLLLAQRLNKKFHAVLQDSLKINQALFLKLASDEYAEWCRAIAVGNSEHIEIDPEYIEIIDVDSLYGSRSGREQKAVEIDNPSHICMYERSERAFDACIAKFV
jgi:hypothetical protein